MESPQEDRSAFVLIAIVVAGFLMGLGLLMVILATGL